MFIKRRKIKSVISFLALISLLFFSAGNCLAADKLLQSGDFTYLGAFAVPGDWLSNNGGTFQYGGRAVTYNPANNSLFMAGFFNSSPDYVAEINIPALKTDSNYYNLNVASYIQSWAEPSENHWTDIGAGGAVCDPSGNTGGMNGIPIGGMLVYNNKLVVSPYAYYDNGPCAHMSHYQRSLTLSATGTYQGPYALSCQAVATAAFDQGISAGYVDGPMVSIPAAYQSQLGGSVLSGNADLSVTGRTSYGPSAAAFYPENFSTTTPATYLVGYPDGYHTLGEWGGGGSTGIGNTPYVSTWNSLTGIVFPSGSRSVLFIGLYGSGDYLPTYPAPNECYGNATTVLSEQCSANGAWSPSCSDGNHPTCNGGSQTGDCCYDPINMDHGPHEYPYHYQVLAYDVGDSQGNNTSGNIDNTACTANKTPYPWCTGYHAGNCPTRNNLTAVKLGYTKPWEVVPYATWFLPTHFSEATFPGVYGATMDNSGRMYVTTRGAGHNGDDRLPAVEVYQVNSGSSGDTASPAAPSGLSVY